jgi:hypothetical protein
MSIVTGMPVRAKNRGEEIFVCAQPLITRRSAQTAGSTAMMPFPGDQEFVAILPGHSSLVVGQQLPESKGRSCADQRPTAKEVLLT